MSNVRAMDPKAISVWSPKIDKSLPDDEKLKIKYHPLDMRQEAAITDEQIKSTSKKSGNSEYKFLSNQADIKRMELMIVDWDNFLYPEGHEKENQPVVFNKENIGLLPLSIRKEFVDEVAGRNIEDEDEIEVGEAQAA